MAIEEPKYSVISKNNFYEIRSYDTILVADTQVEDSFEESGSKAFRILADYIFGNNKSKSKIAMTAPVTQVKNAHGFTYQFTMPEKWNINTIASPNDERVRLHQIPSRKVAVFSYSGSWSEKRFNEKLDEFRDLLKKDGVRTIGEPVFARFNSPFQLWFLRRNEIWLEIAP